MRSKRVPRGRPSHPSPRYTRAPPPTLPLAARTASASASRRCSRSVGSAAKRAAAITPLPAQKSSTFARVGGGGIAESKALVITSTRPEANSPGSVSHRTGAGRTGAEAGAEEPSVAGATALAVVGCPTIGNMIMQCSSKSAIPTRSAGHAERRAHSTAAAPPSGCAAPTDSNSRGGKHACVE